MPDGGSIAYPGAPPEEEQTVGAIIAQINLWEQGIGKDLKIRCDKYYNQYRGFRQFSDEWTRNPNDRDSLLYDAKKHWGAHLHIPMSFRTIESVVPRAIANMPKLLVLPREEQWIKNVETMQLLIDSQQANITIDLPFQAVMRSGMIYGLGVGKTHWRREVKTRRRQQREVLPKGPSGYALSPPEPEVKFDDPMFEDIDIYDFLWDPFATCIDDAEWAVHRSWISTKTIMQRLQEGVWNTQTAALLDEDAIRALGPSGKHYDEIWQDRMLASGFTSRNFTSRGEQPHELLEWHDGERVCTILDRQVLVQEGENGCGDMPFQIYRPIPLQKQFVGIGYLEPLEHLQRELDTLRSQRRDAATIALNPGWVFDDAAVAEEDLTFGPASAIRVTNSRPSEAIERIKAGDVPGSSYQEEQAILSNMDLVSGMQDAPENATAGGSTTATGAQLEQASLGRRIELISRRFEQEVVQPTARCFLYLNQRMIAANRPAMRVPVEGHEEMMEESRWKWYPVGPGELEGEFEIEPEGGSMAAKNIPQERADATQLFNMLAHDWFFNPTMIRMKVAEKMGLKHPKGYLRDPTPSVPMAALRELIQAGTDPNLVIQAVLRARELSAPQEGPSSSQIEAQIPMEGTA